MSDFEKIMIKAQLVNTKLAIIQAQQSSENYIAMSTLLLALQDLSVKLKAEKYTQDKLRDALVQMSERGGIVTQSLHSVSKDIMELNRLIDSFDDDSIDLSNFKFSLN